jgi:protein-histidine pros-kinase
MSTGTEFAMQMPGNGAGLELAQLGALIDALPDAMLVIDDGGTILLVNGTLERLFGHAAGSLLGKPVETLLPDARSAWRRREAAIDAGGSPSATLELIGRRTDGTDFPLEATLAPTRTGDGPIFAAALRDASVKKREDGLFRGLLEGAPDAIVIVDEDGQIQLVNAQVERLFGYERDDLVGKSIEVLMPERFRGMHKAFRHGYVHDPRTRPMGLAGDLFALRKDTSEFPVEISLAPLETDEGLLVSAAVRDISERRRIQEEADRVKDEFFATVSHELRTPLTSMIGYGEMMAELEQLSPQGKRFLSVITRSAERELRLVDDLLTLVAIEESGLAIRTKDVDLEAVVRDAVEAARPPAEEAGLELTLVTPGYAVPLQGDRDRLGQALDNLLSNAIKFTPTGGSVRVVMRTLGEAVEIDVVDSGPGIGDVDPDLLFERLFRASDAVAAQVPGAGLGLTIALAMVEAHHGTITVPSTGEQGATFRIWLPV